MSILTGPIPPVRFLVDDEVVNFIDRRGDTFPIRIRIWRGEHATTVVLASIEMAVPKRLTCKIANYVNQAMAGHSPFGVIYFEHTTDGANVLTRCYFEYFGNSNRLTFFKPERSVQPWEKLEAALGCKVER